jgi:chloramphenicol O-acetyltransferase type A
MKIIDINNWNRKEYFDFFSKMTSPYFGITTEVDCTKAYNIAKEKEYSFFAYYLYKSLVAANFVEELRLRIIDNQVILLDKMSVGTTIGRENGTYGLAFAEYSDSFEDFNAALQKEIEAVHHSVGLRLNDDARRTDLIHYSTIPWTSFSAILHPRSLDRIESIPKIVFGKYSEREVHKFLPVSIEANHALADGFHLAKFFNKFQQELDNE